MGSAPSSSSSTTDSVSPVVATKPRLTGKFNFSWTLPKMIENIPCSLTYDEKHVYICDTSVKCIYLYSFDGKLLSILTPPPRAGEWDPKAIELDLTSHYLYILHLYSVMVLDINKNSVIYKWNLPEGTDWGGEGHLKIYTEEKSSGDPVQDIQVYFTLDNSHLIYVNNIKGEKITTFGEAKKSKKLGLFSYPRGIGIDKRYLYVCDSSNHRVQVLDKKDGKFVTVWGTYGKDKEGEFCFPTGLLLDSNIVYVTDYYRIQVFNTAGKFLHYIGKGLGLWGRNDGEFSDPRGLCMINNKLYVADKDNHRIQVFS